MSDIIPQEELVNLTLTTIPSVVFGVQPWVPTTEEDKLKKEDIEKEIAYYDAQIDYVKDQKTFLGVQREAIKEQRSTNAKIKLLTFVLAGAAVVQVALEIFKVASKEVVQVTIQQPPQSLQQRQATPYLPKKDSSKK